LDSKYLGMPVCLIVKMVKAKIVFNCPKPLPGTFKIPNLNLANPRFTDLMKKSNDEKINEKNYFFQLLNRFSIEL